MKILKRVTIGLLVFLALLVVLISCIPAQEDRKLDNEISKSTITTIPPAPVAPVETYEPLPEIETEDEDSYVYYSSCKQAKAAGAAPLYLGEPGYRTGLDSDGDGKACER